MDEEIVRIAEMSLSEVLALVVSSSIMNWKVVLWMVYWNRQPHLLSQQVVHCITSCNGRIRDYTTTVWLQTSPQNHLQRVMDQGDLRPIEGRSNALMELRQILEQRSPFMPKHEIQLIWTDNIKKH